MNNSDTSKNKFNKVNNSSTEIILEKMQLILQGGGSLGAFGCGVYKSFL